MQKGPPPVDSSLKNFSEPPPGLMSALSPKADIVVMTAEFGFGPQADLPDPRDYHWTGLLFDVRRD
jgi:hypothetical protein